MNLASLIKKGGLREAANAKAARSGSANLNR